MNHTEQMSDKLLLLQMTEDDVANLQKLAPIIEKYSESLTARHYDVLQRFDSFCAMIDKDSSVEALTRTFKMYLASLPQMSFNEAYYLSRSKIGEIHNKIGLTPEWYTGAYIRLYEYLVPGIMEEYGHKPKEATALILSLIRAVIFDTQIVLDAYQSEHEYQVVDHVSDVMESMMTVNQVKEVLEQAKSTNIEAATVGEASEELFHSVQQVAAYAVQTAEQTKQTIDIVEKGKETIDTSLNSYVQMADEFMKVKNNIDSLLTDVSTVSQVVTFIRNVAEQTNLLALNASIEAARAGEHGRGFAVVADEVRKLAEETAKSVNQISDTMTNVFQHANAVREKSDHMTATLNEQLMQTADSIESLNTIVAEITKIGNSTKNIADIAESQTSATEDIANRMQQVAGNSENIETSILHMGEKIYEASIHTNEVRKNAIGLISHMKNLHLLRVSKTEHLLWKWWLYNFALGFHSMDKKQITSEHECRLGKWYDEMKMNESISSLPAFEKLAEPHHKVHKIAQEIAVLIQNGDQENLHQKFGELDQVSEEVIALLDELQTTLQSSGKASAHR